MPPCTVQVARGSWCLVPMLRFVRKGRRKVQRWWLPLILLGRQWSGGDGGTYRTARMSRWGHAGTGTDRSHCGTAAERGARGRVWA